MQLNDIHSKRNKRSAVRASGFTIVELLIVIVIIAILAAITIVAYNGIQQRARDTQRKSDVANIVKALEAYYAVHGEYPGAAGWHSPTAGSWGAMGAALVPAFVSSLPADPQGNGVRAYIADGREYAVFINSTYCGHTTQRQGFWIIYRLEGTQETKNIGECGGTPIGPYAGTSSYRVMK